MKIKSVFRLSILFAISSTCYGAQYLNFRADGAVGDPVAAAGWTQSEANTSNASPKAFINTIGAYNGVSVGAFYDDYTNSSFSVDHSTSLGLVNANVNWTFTINDYTDFATRNDYSISLLDGASLSLATINFTNNVGTDTWNVSVNGDTAFVAVEAGFNYNLFMLFGTSGANATYDLAINGFDTKGTIAGAAGATIGHIQFGETLGAGNSSPYGDGFITVVPEPGAPMLLSLLPAFFILRRRR